MWNKIQKLDRKIVTDQDVTVEENNKIIPDSNQTTQNVMRFWTATVFTNFRKIHKR